MRAGAVLVVTGDEGLRERVCALAERSGVVPEVADLARVRADASIWARAEIVIAGADVAADIAELPRRRDVVVVTEGSDDNPLVGAVDAVGADLVAALPSASGWLADRLAGLGRDGAGVASVVVVAAGRGGAGASVVASALALTAADRGLRVLLVDADELGSGIDLILGLEERQGIRWPGLVALTEPVSATEFLPALPSLGGVSVVSVDRDPVNIPGRAVSAVIGTARRAVDLIVVDVARGGTDASAAAFEWAAHGLLVVPAEARAAVSAAAAAERLQGLVRDLRLLVRGPSPAGMDPDVISQAVGLQLAGSVRADPGIEVALEHGDLPRPRGPLRRFCGEYLSELGVVA